MRTMVISFFLLTFLTLPTLAQEEVTTIEKPLTVEQRLSNLETKIDQLLKIVGEPSGRDSLYDILKRELAAIKQDVKSSNDDIRRLNSEIRKIKPR